jgi:DNA mismatch endonuclease (patch repair protein)
MPDNLSREKRSRIMSTIRGKNTKSELALKEVLTSLHFTYQPKGIYGNPDFANRKEKVAIFIDGCFWHGCRKHFKLPTSNEEFWRKKIERNIRRDREVTRSLRRDGWRVIRVWEHDLHLDPFRKKETD